MGGPRAGAGLRYELIVVLFAALIYLGGIISPPALMDDVDALQAQIARTMLASGDWVTARLDGVPCLEKAPLKYWLMALSFAVFGVHDWAARLPVTLGAILLCWVTTRFGAWAFSARAGFYAGLALATCAGLFLFTRILIPDVLLTLAVTLALWAFLRALDEEEPRPRLWAAVLAASVAAGVLLKGLIALVASGGAAFVYLLATRQLLARRTWRRLRPGRALVALAVMMVMLLHAARLALVGFDPYLSSRPLAEALRRAPAGKLIVDNQYFAFSSVFFYAHREALLLNGRVTNLEYGSYAPGAPQVFIDHGDLVRLWQGSARCYLAAEDTALLRLEGLVGRERLRRVAWAGGKGLYTNLD